MATLYRSSPAALIKPRRQPFGVSRFSGSGETAGCKGVLAAGERTLGTCAFRRRARDRQKTKTKRSRNARRQNMDRAPIDRFILAVGPAQLKAGRRRGCQDAPGAVARGTGRS